jgi:hypothetical protein
LVKMSIATAHRARQSKMAMLEYQSVCWGLASVGLRHRGGRRAYREGEPLALCDGLMPFGVKGVCLLIAASLAPLEGEREGECDSESSSRRWYAPLESVTTAQLQGGRVEGEAAELRPHELQQRWLEPS